MASLREFAKSSLPPPVTAWMRATYKSWAGRYEPEVALLPILCDPGRLGLDVGAALGAYTWHIARHSGACLALEPNPGQAEYLRRAFRDRVRVLQLAASDENGRAEFVVPLDDGVQAAGHGSLESVVAEGRHALRFEVEKQRLDDLVDRPVGFMKIDVEGHEEAVLAGASRIIKQDRPNILIECENRHGADHVSAVQNFFHERGYGGFFLLGKEIVDVQTFTAQKHQNPANWAREHWLLKGVYIYNFVFVPEERQAAIRGSLAARGFAA